MSLRYRYHMFKLKISKLLLFGSFLGSLEVQRLQKPTSQSNRSPYIEYQQHSLTFSKCYLIGMYEAIVYMLYLEFYKNSDSSVIRDPISTQHFEIAEATVSKSDYNFSSFFHSFTRLRDFIKSLYDLRMRTIATSSFTLNILFYILGKRSAINCTLTVRTKSNLLQLQKRVIYLLMRDVQLSKIDSKSYGMLTAQLRLLIIGLRLMRKFCSLCATTAAKTSLSRQKSGQNSPTTNSTMRGVSRRLIINLLALLAMLCNYMIISRTKGNSALRWLRLSESLIICVNLCSFSRYSSSAIAMAFGSASRASLFSPSSKSFLRSSILINSHSILSTLSLSRSAAYCYLYFLSSWAMKSNLSLSDASLRSMSCELVSMRVSLAYTALEQ